MVMCCSLQQWYPPHSVRTLAVFVSLSAVTIKTYEIMHLQPIYHTRTNSSSVHCTSTLLPALVTATRTPPALKKKLSTKKYRFNLEQGLAHETTKNALLRKPHHH